MANTFNHNGKVVITDGGNVGIGNTNPSVALDVTGEIAIRGGESADDARMYFRASDNTNRFTIETDLDGTTSNDLLGFRSVDADNILVLKGNGNVGIGTTSPAHMLDVEGNIRAKLATFYIGTTATNYLSSDNANIYLRTNQIHYFEGNGTMKGAWLANGNLGIGTTAPNAKLNVNTDAMGVTVSDASGISLTNTTAAASGAQQMSPTLKWSGQGWKTTATAASQNVSFISFLTPVQGSTAPSGTLNFASSINGGAYSTRMSLTSAGALSISAGLTATTGVFSSTVTNTIANLTTTPTDGVVIVTPTAATSVIPVRISPRLRISGTAWNTGGTPASNTMNWTIDNLPTSGNPPTSALRFNFDRDGGGYSTLVSFISTGSIRLNNYGSGSNTGTVAYNLAVDSSGNIIETAGGVVDGSGTANYVSKWSDANTLTDSVLYDDGTDVGIGTTSPAPYIDGGAARGLQINNAGRAGIRLHDTGGVVQYFDIGINGNTAFISAIYSQTPTIKYQAYSEHIFETNSSERMRITSAGRVGIATTDTNLARLRVIGEGDVGNAAIMSDYGNTSVLGEVSTIAYRGGVWHTLYVSESGASATNAVYVTGTKPVILNAGNVGIGTASPSQALHVSGSARVTGAYYDSSNSAGSSGQVLSSTGSGTAWVNQGEATATSLYDLLPAARTTYAWTVQLTAGTWADIFSSNTVLSNGTWMVQAFVNDYAVGGQQYSETYSGVMSWGEASSTNQGGPQAISEIVLHRSGHAANSGNFYLRTVERVTSTLLFQGMSNQTYSAASTINFKFVKIF